MSDQASRNDVEAIVGAGWRGFSFSISAYMNLPRVSAKVLARPAAFSNHRALAFWVDAKKAGNLIVTAF